MADSMKANTGKYLLVVTGSVPLAEDGIYTTIGGRTAKDDPRRGGRGGGGDHRHRGLRPLGQRAGGAARTRPARSASRDVIKDRPMVNIAGCPPIADVITATLVHYLTFGRLPEADAKAVRCSPTAPGSTTSVRARANFDAGQFVEGSTTTRPARAGACTRWDARGRRRSLPARSSSGTTKTSWPIGAGHPCIGCTEPHFWDTMTPFYDRLPDVGGYRRRAGHRPSRRGARRRDGRGRRRPRDATAVHEGAPAAGAAGHPDHHPRWQGAAAAGGGVAMAVTKVVVDPDHPDRGAPPDRGRRPRTGISQRLGDRRPSSAASS